MDKKYVKYKNHVIIFEREDSEHPFEKSKYRGIEIFSHCIEGDDGEPAFSDKGLLLDEFLNAITESAYGPLDIFPLYGTEGDFSLEFKENSFVGYLQVSEKMLKAPLLIENFVEELNIWRNHSHFYIKICSLDGIDIVSLKTADFFDTGLIRARKLVDRLTN